ncbi:MAG: hypothetical protein PF795_05955, partial [Kiritimatiellae bacterium]|nr:hypothetical protein [Kiritimatiellia bacterium]
MNYDGVPARKTGTRLALVGLAILLTSPLLPATADTVHLENGQTMEGIVKEETDTHIVFMQFGIRLVLPRASVSKISYASDAHRETLIKDLQSSKPWQR